MAADRVDISVVIPAHDREHTIERTLRSVLAQQGCRFEVLVVDDGSDDATALRAEAIARDHPHVHVIRQANLGVAAARNAGARRAVGRYLTFLDCDDEVAAGWLATYVDALDAGHDLVFSPGLALHRGGTTRPWHVAPLGPAFGSIDGLFNPGMFAVRHRTFLAAGGYTVGMRFSENTELGLRLTAHLGRGGAPIVSTTVATNFVQIHMAPDNRSRADAPAARLEGALLILDQHEAALRRDPALHSSYWALAGVAAARLGRLADARRCFLRSWRARRTLKSAARVVATALPPVRSRLWSA